jgi:glycosyltransferase involved in cell wall biosynthesis/2-polyprenyl-3-methyl-5-hydroxy-6-metoxy-1,4-benzoquinol methylase
MSDVQRGPRLLVFIVAYYAESTLLSVLDRIPARVREEYDCEVLIVDDASEDRTFQIGREYRQAHPEVRLTVLRNGINQGYGGNQKVGYTFAIERGFDFVVLLHGDGQYAPEELPKLLAPLRDGRTDAVIGSRMMTTFGALRGGMPLYKYVGNRVLTAMQNRLLRANLSEFHSGYRAYSVPALRDLRFRLNSNDFHFDTEIIVQLLMSGKRIIELPIPTHYGSEICYVNGLRYAKDVLLVTLQSVAHKAGVFHQRRFEPAARGAQGNSHYDVKLGYPSSHQFTLDAVPAGSRVLDIGAGPGGMAQALVEKGCQVAVVDQFPATDAPGEVEVLQQDLNDPPVFDARKYDYLLMLDVIEHLKDPEQFLEQLGDQFDYAPRKLVLTTPNIAFVVQRLMLALGQFNYGESGILDRTHTRLFTFRTLRRLLVDAGLRIHQIAGIPAPWPKVLGDGWLGRTAVRLNRLLIRVSKTLFSYQIFVVAECVPNARFILRDSQSRSEVPDADHQLLGARGPAGSADRPIERD